MLKDLPIVILDEATASVDADNEGYIQQVITELCRGKTLLIIAHRLNTICHADNIIAIQNGTIAQQGTHGQLIQEDGGYQKFVTVRQTSTGGTRTEGKMRADFGSSRSNAKFSAEIPGYSSFFRSN